MSIIAIKRYGVLKVRGAGAKNSTKVPYIPLKPLITKANAPSGKKLDCLGPMMLHYVKLRCLCGGQGVSVTLAQAHLRTPMASFGVAVKRANVAVTAKRCQTRALAKPWLSGPE